MATQESILELKKKQKNILDSDKRLQSIIETYNASAGAINRRGISFNNDTIKANLSIASNKNAKEEETKSYKDAFTEGMGLPSRYGKIPQPVIRTTGIRTTGLTDAAGSIVDSASGMVDSATSMANGAVSQVTGQISGVMDMANGYADSAMSAVSDIFNKGVSAAQANIDTGVLGSLTSLYKSASSTAGQFSSTIADAASGASSYLGGLIDKAGGMLSSYAGDALATATNMVNKVGSLADEATDWFNGVTSSFLGGESNTEVKTGFKASDNKQGIDKASLPLADVGLSLGSLKDKALGKFQELAGPVNNLVGAVNNVKSKVQGMVQGAVKTGQSIIAAAQNTVNSVLQPVKSTIDTVKAVTNPNNVRATLSKSLDFLPFGLNNVIAKSAYNEAAKFQNKLGMLETRLNGVMGLGDRLQGLLGYSKSPGELTSDLGKIIVGLCSGDVSGKDLDALWKAAMGICPNVATPSYMEFGDNKLVYSALMQQALEYGSAELLSQLANCQKYFGSDTKQLLAYGLGSAAKQGDPSVINAVLDTAGTAIVPDATKLAITVGTNLREEPMDLDATAAYRSEYTKMLEKLDITPAQLTSDSTSPNAISAENLVLLARKPALLEYLGVSDTTRNTVLNAYNYYKSQEAQAV